MLPHVLLLSVALWTAWRPGETVAATPIVVASALLLLVPWAHHRTAPNRLVAGMVIAGSVLVTVCLSAASGWDRAAAVVQISLAAAVVSLVWVGSRECPPERVLRLFAVGISALALWAAWQVAVGFQQAAAAVDHLPAWLQANAADRLSSGRAFASLLLPGHLAALFATVLPLLVSAIRPGWKSLPWTVGAVLCGVGLLLTRSPIGIGLALLAMVALLARRKQRLLIVGTVVLTAILAVAVLWRPDVAELDPVRLRLDNWKTAAWAWSTSPLVGVGIGSFGQAIRGVPFVVGNYPAHAHCLPMEWIAELGAAGVLAVVVFGGWLINLLRRLWHHRPEVAISLAVIPLHNLVDFSLYTSGLAVPWAVLLGWGVAAAGPRDDVTTVARGRVVLVMVAALAVAASILHATSVMVERAAIHTEPADQRFFEAERSYRIAPWRVDPIPAAASAALESGEPSLLTDASALIEAGRRLRPLSSTLAEADGRVHLALGRVPTGASLIWSAARLQPAAEDRTDSWRSLLQRLEAEDHAARR